jgi:anti-sigma28 factor (negative regulator of flagellin synthesis)
MIIQNIEQYQAINIKTKLSKERHSLDVVSGDLQQDTYEPSAQTDSSELRTNLINTVKQRINKGYYNSNEVLDDLVDSFANALNRLSDSG